MLLGAWKCLGDPRPRWAALAGGAFGLQLLAGSPYPPLYSVLGALGAAAATALGRAGPRPRALAWLAAGLALGALVGCAQYLPTLMLARGLPPSEFGSVMQARFSLRLRDLLDFAGPWLAGYPNWQKCFYVGLAGLAFAGFGLLPGRPGGLSRGGWRLAALLAAAGIVFAQGGHLGTDRLIEALPLVGRAGKWPTMALSLAVLGLGLLAGSGLQRRLEGARPASGPAWPAAFGLLAAVLAADALAGCPALHALQGWLAEPMLLFRSPSIGASALARDRMAEAMLGGTAAVLAGWFWAHGRGFSRPRVAAFACACAAAELLAADRTVGSRFRADLYAEAAPPEVARLLGAGYDRGASRILVPKSFDRLGDIAYGSEAPGDFRALRALYNLDTVMSWRVFTTQGSGSVQLPDYQFRLQPVLDGLAAGGSPQAGRLLGAWNVAVVLRGGAGPTGLHAEFVRNVQVLPRARLVERNVNLPSADDALEAIARGQWDPDTALTALDQRLPEYPAEAGAPGSVTGLAYTPAGIAVSCEAARPCFLVLAENWAAGWSASVDGAAVPLCRVNYLQQAVRLAPGRHEVAFRYRAPGATGGFLLSILGLAGLGCCAAAPRKK